MALKKETELAGKHFNNQCINIYMTEINENIEDKARHLQEEQKKREDVYKHQLERDLDLQISTVVNYAMDQLWKKFSKDEEFDFIARDFTTFVDINEFANFYSPQLLANISDLLPGIVIERYGGESLYSLMRQFVQKGTDIEFDKCAQLLEKLRFIPFIKKLDEHVGYENFTEWVEDKKRHDELFRKLSNSPDSAELFSNYGYENTVEMLSPLLKATVERAYRSDGIQDFINEKKSIEEKVKSVFEWYEQRSEWWWNDEVQRWFPGFKPEGYQGVTTGEIVPKKFKKDYIVIGKKDKLNRRYDSGPLGGKVIKMSDKFSYMEKEFTYTQIKIMKRIKDQFLCNELEKNSKNNHQELITQQHLVNLRQRYLRMLIARCYIAPQIIEKILDFVEELSDFRPDICPKHEKIRHSYYFLFFNQAQTDEAISYLSHKMLTETQVKYRS